MMNRTLLVAVLAVVSIAAGAQTPAIVGVWHGTSLCVDKARHPACNDEEALYEILPVGHSRDTVFVKADKIVNGARDVVSHDQFVRQPDDSWMTELRTPRYRLRLTLWVKRDSLIGTLVDLADNRSGRDMRLARARSVDQFLKKP